MIDRFTMYAKVKEVKILEHVSRGFKNDNGEAQIMRESLGWYVTLDVGNLSFSVGDEDPGWRPGDKVAIHIEKGR